MKLKSMIVNANMKHPIPLPGQSVHCVVTSIPYYLLRDYGEPGQIGLENTIKEYIQAIVKVFQEVRRVLRNDGTCWVNIGDTYAAGGRGGTGKMDVAHRHNKNVKVSRELPAKNMMLIPQRLIIALQDDGWIVRSDIIWSKPNPMPESVNDRPTKAHEHIFLLTKSKRYYYDDESIKEDKTESTKRDCRQNKNGKRTQRDYPGSDNNGGTNLGGGSAKRNKRSVWTMPTRGYQGAHFATFPPELPEICIKAGTSDRGVCSECGAAWVRVVEKELIPTKKAAKTFVIDDRDNNADNQDQGSNRQKDGHKSGHIYISETKGWNPGCKCNASRIPAIVCDPFNGSGTTPAKAQELGRHGIGFDLSFPYCKLALERTGQKALNEWENGIKDNSDLSDLPLFGELDNG